MNPTYSMKILAIECIEIKQDENYQFLAENEQRYLNLRLLGREIVDYLSHQC